MGFYLDGSGQHTHRKDEHEELEREDEERLRPSPGKSSRTHGGSKQGGIPGKVALTARLVQRIDCYTRPGQGVTPEAREMVAQALETRGQPLPEILRRSLEEQSGRSLSDVRIHTGPESARAAQSLGAEAFTVDRDIHFAAGMYQPESASGRKLIAHEVTHAIQQRGLPAVELERAAISEPGQPHERAADEFAGLFERSAKDGHLPAETQARMERAFGHSFADVRVHPESPRASGRTHAVTQGRDIHFAPGSYQPGTERGDWLIGHELAHVIQQQGGGGGARRGETPALEAEADQAATAALAGQQPAIQLSAAHGSAQAFTDPPEPQQKFVDEDGNPREPTEEELEQMIREARQEGQSRADSQDTGDTGEPAPQPGEPPVGTAEPQPDVSAEGVSEPEQPGFAAVPPGPDGELPSFESLKSAPLSKWDDEMAWHQYFQGSGPMDGIQVDRDALISDALSGGALAGFQAGLKNVAIDTLINVASSRIPYLQGFVEMARIAYDPQAWLEGTVQSTVGNMVNGGAMLWEGVTSGDPIAALDGLLTILDGINNVIGTLSSLCWIVAAASFVLSFICPAALPFAALAANWAVTLGTISTAFGIFITLGRAVVITMRFLQIKYGDADPATLLEQGERLRAQTQAFTGEFTTRAGNRLRGAAQDRLQNRGQARSTTQTPQRQNSASANPPSRMQRITNALNTGATVLSGGGNPRQAMGEALLGTVDSNGNRRPSALETSLRGTQAWAGRGEYARPPGGGTRTRRQQAADMEHAGLTVFHSDRARVRFNEQTAQQGEKRPAVNRELVEDHQAATQRLRQASDQDLEAQRRLQEAEQAANEARQRLRQAEQDDDLQARIRATEDQHQADQRRLQEAQRAVEVQEHVIRALEARREQLITEGAPQYQINIYNKGISDARIELLDRQTAVSHVRVAEATSNLERLQARQPMVGARNLDAQAQETLDNARTTATGTADNRGSAEQGVRDANAAFRTSDRVGGMTQEQSGDFRDRNTTQRQQWYFDFTGKGPSDLHGHNKGSGVTGAGTGIGVSMADSVYAEFTEDQSDDTRNPLGVWERTSSGQPLDLMGDAGGRGQDDYQGRLQQRFDQLKQALPAPPEGIAGTIDGAREAYAALDEEKRQIIFQQEVMQSLLEEADASMSALDAVQAISAANQEAIATHQQQLGDKHTAQGDLRDAATETQGQATEGEQSGASTAETVGGFLSRFLEMLNIVPSQVLGDGGGDGIQQVHSSAQQQEQVSGDARATADRGVSEADRMEQETQQAENNASEDLTCMQGADEQIMQEQLSTMDGQTFLQQTLEDARTRQGELEGEMARLQGEHQGAVQSGSAWATTHEQQRVAGLGELDGIVELIEQGGQGGQNGGG
jgi:hypothetical protein